MIIKYFDTEMQTYGTMELPTMAVINNLNEAMKENYKNLKSEGD